VGPRLDLLVRVLGDDSALAAKDVLLSNSVSALVDDGREIEPPADLARRTILAVAEQRRKQKRRSLHDLAPDAIPFRWADLGMAAGIFLAGVVVLLPAIQRSRAQAGLTACASNLRELGVGLNRYAMNNGHFPSPPTDYPAGAYTIMLRETGNLPNASIIACPCNQGDHSQPLAPEFAKMADVTALRPDACRNKFRNAYAYTAGFERNGQFAPMPLRPSFSLPVLADQPPHDGLGVILEGNSPDHGGTGQNVLFSDGHVGWMHNRYRDRNDPDIYLNHHKRPAPGVDVHDAVLVPSTFSISGP
jgi:prepilin-type processing-associated H-X9-DG protein